MLPKKSYQYLNFTLLVFICIIIFVKTQNEKVGDQDVFLNFTSLTDIKNNQDKNIMRIAYIDDNSCFSFTDYHLNEGVANPSLTTNVDDYMLAETYVFTDLSFESIRNNGIYFGIGFGSETMFGSTYVILYYLGSDNWSVRDAYTDDKEHNVKFKLDQSKVQLLKKTWFTKINIKDLNYKNMFYFKWKRILNKLDNFDYLGLKEWRTSKFPTIASFGFLNKGIIQRHIVRSKFNEVRMESTSFNTGGIDNIANNIYFKPFKTPNNDVLYSNLNNLLIPYYNICDALKYSTINGKQLYFNFSNNGHSSMLIYDIKLSSLYVRGSTYLFTTRMFKDVHTTGVYSGLVFDSSNLFKYAIMTKFVANSNSKEINNEIYDTWLDTKYTFNDKLGSRNKNNGALNIFKGAWFEFSAETKEKRFLNYNSLWVVDWYITLEYYNNTEIDIVKYLREENNILTGIHNLNNKEYEPVLTDMISLNKGVVSNDGSGILSFESEMNKCNSLSSNSFHIRNISHIYYFSIFSFLLLFQ